MAVAGNVKAFRDSQFFQTLRLHGLHSLRIAPIPAALFRLTQRYAALYLLAHQNHPLAEGGVKHWLLFQAGQGRQ